MKTITLDILDDKALDLLKNLEDLKIVKIQKGIEVNKYFPVDFVAKYKGKMSKQSSQDINKQVDEMRNEWNQLRVYTSA